MFICAAFCVAIRTKKSDPKMNSRIATESQSTQRENLVRLAFYRGETLTIENPDYVKALDVLTGELLREDAAQGDLTVEALGIGDRECTFEIRAKEAGVAAGVSEAEWLYGRAGLKASGIVKDGVRVAAGDALLRTEGRAEALFRLERVVVNLMQRMSGIATTAREMVEEIKMHANASVIATRKTPWGLLDKRAVHIGGGGTHRLSLSDAILIKTNHLRLAHEAQAISLEEAIRCAWRDRGNAAFVEVEVTTIDEAVTAAGTFRDLQVPDSCPCVLMLDNFSPSGAEMAVKKLRDEDLHDAALVEASGNVEKKSLAAYAAAGVDAISVGALTHSARALDISAKLISGTR
jgi:nicotinate-nucleotide pyrophosphorylase (carboxylating)